MRTVIMSCQAFRFEESSPEQVLAPDPPDPLNRAANVNSVIPQFKLEPFAACLLLQTQTADDHVKLCR